MAVVAPPVDRRRPLPEDPEAFEAAIAQHRIYGQFIVQGVGAVYEAMDVRPLSPREAEQGERAFAAYLYQHELEVRAEILLMLWFGGTGAPRVAEYVRKRKAKKLDHQTIQRARDELNAPRAVEPEQKAA